MSPTLSAITAGFLGSSSGIPSSTFPVKSAAISAVFVKIPPPAFANNASELAPKLNANTISGFPVKRYNIAAPISEVPTTAIPITAPPLNPHINDFSKLFLAVVAVFTFAIVAMLIPIYPAKPDNTEPKIYDPIIYTLFIGVSVLNTGSGKNNRINVATTSTNIAKIEYSFFKNVNDPFLINSPTFFTLSFAVGNFATQL